jgi:tetratricopeptide (TPR) repeat protein
LIEIYEEFLRADPDRYLPLTIRVLYAEALASTGRIDEAIAVLEGLLGEVPVELDYLRLQYDLANLLVIQGRREEALKAYQRLLLRADEQSGLVSQARGRVQKMSGRESKKRDKVALELLNIETSLDAGQVPAGAKEFLRRAAASDDPETVTASTALLTKVRELEDQKATALLNEARRLFDERRRTQEVRALLEQILKDYPESTEIQSVKILMGEVDRRLGRRPSPPSGIEPPPESAPEPAP